MRINGPRTVRQYATVSFDRAGNSNYRLSNVNMLTMVFQEGSGGISKSRKTGDVKTHDLAHNAIRQKREPGICSANVSQQNVLGRNSFLPFGRAT
jgi:hypothetical protein